MTDLFSAALRHHQLGQLSQAEALYRQVLGREPNHAETLHNLGVLARQSGRDDIAVDFFRQAIALNDQAPAFHSNLGAALKGLSRLDEAVAAYRRAIALKPDYVEAHYNLGNALAGQGELEGAAGAYRRAITLKPDLTEAHYNLGNAYTGQGKLDEAAGAYQHAIALKPDHAQALNNLGVVLKDLGRLAEASAAFQRALALKPGFAEAHANFGNVLKDQDKPEEAMAAYQRALSLNADIVEAHHNLGVILGQKGRPDEAVEAYQRALTLKPDYAEAHYNLGVVLGRKGKLDEAAAAYQQAIALKPDFAEAHLHLASLQTALDTSPEAAASFERLSRQADELEQLEPKARIALLFAMGKALEGRGEFDRAFDCLAKANAIHRASLSFDIAEVEQRMAQVAKTFDRGLLERLTGAGEASERPVFIVGMPRSGTTLVEQIISAHPAVHGAGEIPNLETLVGRSWGPSRAAYPFWAQTLSGEDRRAIGQAYLQSLPPAAGGAQRVTDKMVSNFEHLGLIHLCLPNARIIHCRRDPRDVGISCFALRFSNGLEFTYDLAELGRYWRAYDQLMAHWRAVLPPGRVLEAPYEAVVEDIEGWARRLIAHCGLEWDEACLRFYESEREVRTASLAQVRRPIYASSVGRWRAFERHLGPLLEALGEPWASRR